MRDLPAGIGSARKTEGFFQAVVKQENASGKKCRGNVKYAVETDMRKTPAADDRRKHTAAAVEGAGKSEY